MLLYRVDDGLRVLYVCRTLPVITRRALSGLGDLRYSDTNLGGPWRVYQARRGNSALLFGWALLSH